MADIAQWSDQLEDDDITIVGAPTPISDAMTAASAPEPMPAPAPTPAPAKPTVPREIAKTADVPPNLPVVGGPVTEVSSDPDLALLQKIADARARETAAVAVSRAVEPSALPAPTSVPAPASVSAPIPAAPSSATATPKTPFDAAADEAIAAIGVQSTNEDLLRRLRMLVSLYFRDLRDALETSSKLTMPVASGGMGLTEAQAAQVMRVLAERNAAFHADARARITEGKEQFVAERTSRVLGESDRRESADRAARDRVFSSVTGQQVAHMAPVPAPAVVSQPRTIPVVAQGKGQVVQPVVATAKPPVPLPPPPPSRPIPSSPPPPQSAAPLAPSKPSMSDINVAPRLVGPVEELRAMTLKDFRRLSKEPKEATLKLRDKIDLLAEQSFEKRTEGVHAWQDSAVNKAYLDLLRRSLEGRPVLELIAERQAKGEEALSKAEFDSIMEFNRSLRFG